MVTTTRRQSHLKAYTIIESLVVLAILAILTVVVVALYMHEMKPADPAEALPASANSAPVKNVSANPSAPTNKVDKEE